MFYKEVNYWNISRQTIISTSNLSLDLRKQQDTLINL